MSGFVELDAVDRTYYRGQKALPVLAHLTLSIPKGDFVALMGPSGSGKTTILNLIGGLDAPDAGHVVSCGVDLGTLSDGELARWRARHVGFVFQSFNLIPVLSAMENVLLPLHLTPLGRAARKEQAMYALEIVGLTDRVHHRPRQLSGGQEQRVAIARAIATDPDLVLADEPTGDLDRESAAGIMELLARLNREMGKTIVMVTHDQVSAETARRVLHLDKGLLLDGNGAAGTGR